MLACLSFLGLPGQASTHHYLTCLDGLLTANKVPRKFEFSPLRHRVVLRLQIGERRSKYARARGDTLKPNSISESDAPAIVLGWRTVQNTSHLLYGSNPKESAQKMDKQFAKSPIKRKMTRVTSSYLGALVVLCIALGVAGEGWAQESEHQPEMIAGKVTTGALEYRRHCAPCHGPDGKGDGPVGKAMTTKPSDLTQITKGHGGKFPEDWVHRYIDGSDMIPAHGTSEMPIWGVEFSKTTLGPSSRMKHEIDTRIRLLVNYIKSIQEK